MDAKDELIAELRQIIVELRGIIFKQGERIAQLELEVTQLRRIAKTVATALCPLRWTFQNQQPSPTKACAKRAVEPAAASQATRGIR